MDQNRTDSVIIANTSDQRCVVSFDKKDPMRLWQEMKQNGFLTQIAQMPTPKIHSNIRTTTEMFHKKLDLQKEQQLSKCTMLGVPATVLLKEVDPGVRHSAGAMPVPKSCRKVCRGYMSKKKMKVTGLQLQNRYNKIAAPSGLLDKINPGIINRIRNSEQVFSVIESLVRRDEVADGRVQSREVYHNKKRFKGNDVNEITSSLSGSCQSRTHAMTQSGPLHMQLENNSETYNLAVGRAENDEGKDEIKSSIYLSRTSDSASSSMSIEESEPVANCFSLSRKGSMVASQWLQFFHNDIERRLAALWHSRKRVQDVMKTELPYLVLNKFSLCQENGQSCAARCNCSTDVLQAKWKAQFERMDKALQEELDCLELWLTQVIEMQKHSNAKDQ